jgi:hypothetical protein
MARVDNNWTNEIEILVKQWGEQADNLDSKYSSQSKRQKLYYYMFMIPTIIAQGIISGLTIYNIISNHIATKIIIVTASILLSIALALITLFQYDASSQASSNISAKYSRLCTKLETELQKERKHREDGLVFIEYARRKYARLGEISPDLTGNIKKLFTHWCIGSRNEEPTKEIIVAKEGDAYASDDAVANAAKVSDADKAAIDQFIGDNMV